MFLWLRCRLTPVAPIRPRAWELPYAIGYSPKKQKNKKELALGKGRFSFLESGDVLRGGFVVLKTQVTPLLMTPLEAKSSGENLVGSGCQRFEDR